MRCPPNPGQVLLPVDNEAFQPRRQDWGPVGAGGRYPEPAHVPEAVLDLPCHAPAQQALHRRQLQEHRRPQPDKLQHEVRPQDPDDDLPRDCAPGLHGVVVDHRQLDAETVRKVRRSM